MVEARFDDLTAEGTSFRLIGLVGLLEASRPDEVEGVIQAAEAAAARGLWAAGFVAYEAAPGFDPSLTVRARRARDPFPGLPLAWFALFERPEQTELPAPREDGVAHDAWLPSIEPARFEETVGRIRERIGGGDTYQVNFTLRLRSTIRGDPRGLYRDLCYAQRGAYASYLDLGRYRILSASPELFFELADGHVRTRPMKGTAPRGRWPAEDEEKARTLLASAKDRAENAMIVDLLRNDLGRIASGGSIRWDDVFEVERYETVWQLTSTVSAELAPGLGVSDVFRGLFPSGSVTGAPKVRTMELIADLEDSPRGVYCGAVGFLAPPRTGLPAARFNVAIRTATLDAETGLAEYGVGGGITWGSRARAEYEETVAKAKVLTARRPRFDLLETILHEPGSGYRRLDGHLRRLRESAAYFAFAFPEDAVREALDRIARDLPERPARVRLLLSRDGTLSTGWAPLPTVHEPLRLAIDREHAVDPSDVMLFHKTSLRIRYEDARARHPDADDVVLVNARGEATETTIANIAAKLDGLWRTPPLECGLLPGVERTALLEEGTITEMPIPVDELAHAEELAVLSSVRGLRRAELLQREAVTSEPR